jgi:hypothetical protein
MEFPAAFDAEGNYMRALGVVAGAFAQNAGSVVPLSEGVDLLVGNVPAYVQYGAPQDADIQRVDWLRTTGNGETTYSYTVHHVGPTGHEVTPPTRGRLFTGFGVEHLLDYTENIAGNVRYWAEQPRFDRVEGTMVATTISGENGIAEAAQAGVTAENRALRRRRFSSRFRLPHWFDHGGTSR